MFTQIKNECERDEWMTKITHFASGLPSSTSSFVRPPLPSSPLPIVGTAPARPPLLSVQKATACTPILSPTPADGDPPAISGRERARRSVLARRPRRRAVRGVVRVAAALSPAVPAPPLSICIGHDAVPLAPLQLTKPSPSPSRSALTLASARRSRPHPTPPLATIPAPSDFGPWIGTKGFSNRVRAAATTPSAVRAASSVDDPLQRRKARYRRRRWRSGLPIPARSPALPLHRGCSRSGPLGHAVPDRPTVPRRRGRAIPHAPAIPPCRCLICGSRYTTSILLYRVNHGSEIYDLDFCKDVRWTAMPSMGAIGTSRCGAG